MSFSIQSSIKYSIPLSDQIVISSSHGCLKMTPENLQTKMKRPKAYPINKEFAWEISGKSIKCSTSP